MTYQTHQRAENVYFTSWIHAKSYTSKELETYPTVQAMHARLQIFHAAQNVMRKRKCGSVTSNSSFYGQPQQITKTRLISKFQPMISNPQPMIKNIN